jgi:hypothetical protein
VEAARRITAMLHHGHIMRDEQFRQTQRALQVQQQVRLSPRNPGSTAKEDPRRPKAHRRGAIAGRDDQTNPTRLNAQL